MRLAGGAGLAHDGGMTPPEPDRRTAFVVHGLAQARAACAAAVASGRAIALISAPGAAQSVGIGWFKALVEETRGSYPTVDMIAVLDCGDAAGRTLQALSQGLRHLLVDARSPALPRLRDIAAQHGAAILTARPICIDLGTVADPEAACRAALAGGGGD